MGDNAKEYGGRLVILASASPRRRELMQRLGRPFVSETSSAKEIVPAEVSVPETAEYLYQQVVRKEAVSSEITDYAAAYAAMDPKEAAQIFNTMGSSLDLVGKILGAMNSTQRGAILGAMDPEIAAQVTRVMEPD